MLLKELWQTLLELLYPKRCPCCGALIEDALQICATCQERVPDIRFVSTEILRPCYLDGLIFCTHYKLVKRVLHKAKFVANKEQAILLGEVLLKAWQQTQTEFFAQLYNYQLQQFTAVTVPTDYKRWLARGYEVPQVIFAAWLRANKVEYQNVLRRVRNTAPQYQLTRKQRQENVLGSIQQIRQLATDKFLIMDDIFTTGASLNESARILKLNGAKTVVGLAFASDNS